MSEGQQANYIAGFDHPVSCHICGFSGFMDVGMTDFGEDIEEEYDYEPTSSYHTEAEELLRLISSTRESNNSLLNKPTPESQFLIRILYATAITALETYLSNAFKYNVYNNDKCLLKFIRTYPKFSKDIKLTLPSIISDGGNLDRPIKELVKEHVRKEINKIIFHNLPLVNELFRITFSIRLPKNWEKFMPAIQRRHDIYHRGGEPQEGVAKPLTIKNLTEITKRVRKFIDTLDERFRVMESKDAKKFFPSKSKEN